MKILFASSIYPPTIEELRENHDIVCAFNAKKDELIPVIKDREVLIFRSGVKISAEVMEVAPDLKILIRAGSGTDNVDLDYVYNRGLKFYRIPEPGAKAVAEMSIGLMIGLARNIVRADTLLRKGRWAKSELVGYLLTEKVLGVVGTGNIGSRVASLGVALGMKVIGCDKNPSPDFVEKFAEMNIKITDFEEVITTADFISIHVPLDDSTRNLIDVDVLSKVKPGAFLVNLARGGVVDEQALYKALTKEGGLCAAALDVHQNEGEGKVSPLAELPNVILTPHIGAQAVDAQREIGVRILEIMSEVMESGKGSLKTEKAAAV
jgi:D-3-phosphoglycerate dehydrogenase